MVAKLDGPQFSGGANIAIKCPSHTYEQTIAFYRDTLGLKMLDETREDNWVEFDAGIAADDQNHLITSEERLQVAMARQ